MTLTTGSSVSKTNGSSRMVNEGPLITKSDGLLEQTNPNGEIPFRYLPPFLFRLSNYRSD